MGLPAHSQDVGPSDLTPGTPFPKVSYKDRRQLEPSHPKMVLEFLLLRFSPTEFLLDIYSIGGGKGHPLQFSHLGSPMDRGAWRATVHGVAVSQTRLSTPTYAA